MLSLLLHKRGLGFFAEKLHFEFHTMNNLCTDNTGSADQLLPHSGGPGVGLPTSPQRPCLTSALRRSSWDRLWGWELRCALCRSSRYLPSWLIRFMRCETNDWKWRKAPLLAQLILADIIYSPCYDDADDEKVPPASASASAGPLTAPHADPTPHIFLDRLRELKTCRCSLLLEYLSHICCIWVFNEEMCTVSNRMLCFTSCCSTADDVIGILSNYLLSELPLDIENVHQGALTLRHLKCTLGTACQSLHRSAHSPLLLWRSCKRERENTQARCSMQTVIMQMLQYVFCTLNKIVLCVSLWPAVRLTKLSQVWKPWLRCLTIPAALWHTWWHRYDREKPKVHQLINKISLTIIVGSS